MPFEFLNPLLYLVNSDSGAMSAAGSEEEDDIALETLKFNFNIESLGLVLYNNQPTQVSFSLGLPLTEAQSHLPLTVVTSSDHWLQFAFRSKSAEPLQDQLLRVLLPLGDQLSVLVPAVPGAAAPGRAQAGRVCSPSPEDLREAVGQWPTGGGRHPESLHAGRPEDGHGKGDVPVSRLWSSPFCPLLRKLRPDLRLGCRMVGRRDEGSEEAMVDVTYRQSARERHLVAILQKLYLCASTEFLMAVTDFFLQALAAAPLPKERLTQRQSAEPQADGKLGE